jgi:hypothetical protein
MRAAADGLVADGSIDAALDLQGNLFGTFDDVPSSNGTTGEGLVVPDSYDPDLLRSFKADDGNDDRRTGLVVQSASC